MKRIINYILAALFLVAAMSLNTSCQKEQQPEPDKPTTPQVTANDFEIDVEKNVTKTVYMWGSFEIPFVITKGSLSDFETVKKSEGASLEITTEGNKGIIKVITNTNLGSGSVTFKNARKSVTVEFSFDTFYFHLIDEAATISNEGGEFLVKIETNLPCDWIVTESESVWIEISKPFVNDEGYTCIPVKSESNATNVLREGILSIHDKENHFEGNISVSQDYVMTVREDAVNFTDRNFMTRMLEIADTDGDHFVSFEEALQVKEIDISNRGVTDLKGLEYFKNVWKLDAQNNDIVDATVLKELRYLYWLDLKGNMNLKTFDVTGCSVYFEHCEFEATQQLLYYTTRQQVQVTNTSDWFCKHSKHVIDPDVTTDWSRQEELTLVRKHTKGKGYPFVFTGWGFIQKDIDDGSYERFLNDAIRLMIELNPRTAEYVEYIDFYTLLYIRPNRNEYILCSEQTDAEVKEVMAWVEKNQGALFDKWYKKFVPGGEEKKMTMLYFNINSSSRSFNSYMKGLDLSPEGWYTHTSPGGYFLYNMHTQIGSDREESYSQGNSRTLYQQIKGWADGNINNWETDYYENYVKN